MSKRDIPESAKEYLRNIGAKGGANGKGASKARGDRAYYVALRAKVKAKEPKKDTTQAA